MGEEPRASLADGRPEPFLALCAQKLGRFLIQVAKVAYFPSAPPACVIPIEVLRWFLKFLLFGLHLESAPRARRARANPAGAREA